MKNFQRTNRKCLNLLHGKQGVDLFLRDVENVLANVDDGLLGHLAPEPHVLHHPLASLQHLEKKLSNLIQFKMLSNLIDFNVI